MALVKRGSVMPNTLEAISLENPLKVRRSERGDTLRVECYNTLLHLANVPHSQGTVMRNVI